MPQGRHRSRLLQEEIKGAVVALVRSKLCPSGGAAFRMLRRVKRFTFHARAACVFNVYELKTAVKELAAGAKWMQLAQEAFVSLSWDATRLSGRETLWAACISPSTGMAAWAPPQV